MKNALTALAGLSLALAASFTAADTQVIHAGELLAVPGKNPLKEQTVVITDGRITEVVAGYQSPDGYDAASLIDLKDSFVMPGLMDMHVHLQGELSPDNDSRALRWSDELVQMYGYHNAMTTLRAGFTTVRDAGSRNQQTYAVRDAINKGWVVGPRIIAAGGVGITGGHNDVSGTKHEFMELMTDESVCDGPYDCRRATRNGIKYGADFIKITSTGGVLTDRATGTGKQMEDDELVEVVRAAHRMGRKVASHAHQEEGIIAALKAGVDSIEHGTYAGPAAIKEFKRTGAYLVPTLLAGATVGDMAKMGGVLTPAQAEKAIEVSAAMQGNFAKAYKAGVKIAFGTDSAVSRHGLNAREAELMNEAGMSEMDILVSATVNAADLIDMSDSLGTIEAGKHADIIATRRSPLDDIKALQDVSFVMKGGMVVK
ncbi:metal-dependent hydrolase family protein [Congregibacter litoralis]|uniref:Putative dipeptidase n=1 Tax=Congregibacter litoralis KT71 TaxID=314285 RepID=A4A5U3_9GAMM|nr:amidohydrolase family protein [Congregibacter litoralis]EAQ98390.2 putative dipeptidase [Congregibacter litoralis KT71]